MYKQFSKGFLAALVVLVILVCCSMSFAQGNRDQALDHVRQVHAMNIQRLLSIKGVQGSAVGLDLSDKYAITVFVDNHGVGRIPVKLDEVPVQLFITGKFYALTKPTGPDKPGRQSIDPTSYFTRPVPIGVSTGNANSCSAGTIGCRVIDNAGHVYALSNNHVFALENTADIGNQILQPGRYDTTCLYDASNFLGNLFDYIPITFNTYNTVDAALAFVPAGNLDKATPSDGYGTPKSIPVAASINQNVQKYGRTTSLTKGTVTGIDAVIQINMMPA